MTKRTLLVIGLIILFQPFSLSQTSSNITDSLFSENLQEYRKFYVQLPQGYNKSKEYPVTYILDGEILLPAVNVTHQFYSGGFFPEMILIGIDNSKNRTRDLTPSEIKTKYGMPFNVENGKADEFLSFLESELIPYVEKNYSATNYRTLIGHSYGGLFTVYSLIKHPNLFDNYLAADPSLDWDNQSVINELKAVSSTESFIGKSLYISLSGQLHMQNSKITIHNVMNDTSDFTLFARSNLAFSGLIKQNKDIRYQWELFDKDIHGTVALPSIRSGLIFLFKWFQMENTDKINSFDTPKEELRELVLYRANKLKEHFGYYAPPYPEELLNMSGYMNLEMGQPGKSKMYFEFAIEYYPNSPNAYDSMAEFYESINDKTNALKHITKAYELSGDAYYKKRMEDLSN